MLFQYLFHTYEFRKIYLDVHDFKEGSFGSVIANSCVEEGRFSQHTWYDDRYWDMVRLALYRDKWPELRDRARLVLGLGEEAAELLARQQAQDDRRSEGES